MYIYLYVCVIEAIVEVLAVDQDVALELAVVQLHECVIHALLANSVTKYRDSSQHATSICGQRHFT